MREGVAKEAKTPEQRRVRRSRWIAIAGGLLIIGFISSFAYFGLRYFRDSSYQDERAFRVLGHVVGQFGNLQNAIAGAVQLAGCLQKPGYVERLALRGDVKFALGEDAERLWANASPKAFRIDPTSVDRTFSVATRRDASQGCDVVLSGPLSDQIPIFINQTLFDQVAIASDDGTVLARVNRDRDQSQQVQLHSVAGTDLFGGNVAVLLRRAAASELQASTLEKAKEAPAQNIPSTPGTAIVYSHEVGGQAFRVFVLPFEPAQETDIGDRRVTRLYLVGLLRQNVLHSMSEALGSGGALFITLGVLLGVLSWPFMSLRFASVQEAIGPTQLIAILLALLLIPAVVATTGFSIWTRHKLMLWSDQHAEIYAYRVEQALIREMDSSLHVLESLAKQMAQNQSFVDAHFLMGTTGKGSEAACVMPHECKRVLERPRPPGLPPEVPEDWSPIRSAAPLNAEGKSSGLTLSFYRGDPPGDELDLRDREYYLAIKAGEEWRPGALWHETQPNAEHRFVAQRLFNRSDAARALQLAVPIDAANERKGLFTGDTRVYGLSTSLRPPLLRFAIFDHRSGALVFHTHDERSLAENLIVETEGNASLVEAMQKRASTWSRFRIQFADHFTGRYMGAAHRFYHRAIPGTPWGLVVLYETDSLNTIVLQTAVATLATYFAIIAIAALLLGLLVILLRQRADVEILRWIWPKWSSRDHYRLIRLVGTCVLTLLAVIALGRLNDVGGLRLMLFAMLLIAIFAVAIAARTLPALASKFRPRGPSFVTYKRSYVQSLFVVLCLISAVPVIGIAIGYHDTSVHAFIRDELFNAAIDEEHRRRTMLRDDRGFNATTEVNVDRAVQLSRTLQVPGYRYAAIGDMKQPSWLLTDPLPSPWLFECGPPLLDQYRNWIWSLSTARQVQRPIASNVGVEPSLEERLAKLRSGECPPLAVRARRRSDDGIRVSVALPLEPIKKPAGQDLSAIGLCPTDKAPTSLCRDPELRTVYAASSAFVLGAVTLGGALLVLLLSAHVARRLFGVRIPFAGRFVPSAADESSTSALLDAELELVRLKNTDGFQLTSKDEADWRASKCEPIYRQMWEALGHAHDQQLLLLHLAHGRYANPENQLVIEQLLQRGYITLAPWPRIIEPGFAEFIRRVHPSDALDELRFEASHTPWSQWRTPILVLVIIIAALLMWLAGSAMHILVGVLGGVATLFGSITQVTSFIHRDKPK